MVLLVAACLGAVYLIAHLIAFEYGRDQGIYAVVADAVLRGKAPYQAAWDFKTPGIYFVYALAKTLFGSGMHAVRILEALSLLSLCGAFVILSRRHAGSARAGIIAGAIAVFGYVHVDFWFTAQPESFGAAALAWALVCATYTAPIGAGRRRFWAWTGAAALFAFAALLKPPLGGGFLVSLWLILRNRKHSLKYRPWVRRSGVPLLAFLLGGALPVLAVLAYFAFQGALGDLHAVLFEFVPGYTAVDFDAAQLPAFLLKAVYQWLIVFSPFILIGLVALCALPCLHSREREGALHVLGAVAFILLGVVLQAKFFKYHYAAAVALAALPAGWGIWKVWIRVRRSVVGLAGFGLIVVVLTAGWIPGFGSASKFWSRCAQRIEALVDPDKRNEINGRLYSLGDVNAAANHRAAQWIARRTPPDSSLFIWGFEPIIYDLAQRRPASRYIYNIPLRAAWGPAGAYKRLFEEVTAAQPAAVIVVRRDVLPRVTGNEHDSMAALSDFPELASWIDKNYEHAVTFEDLMILQRKDRGP